MAKSKKKTSSNENKKSKVAVQRQTIKHSGSVWGVMPKGFKRVALTYGNETYTFRVNPGDYDYERATRQATYRTQNANVVQQFGADMATITFTGTTGFHTDSNGNDGQDRFDKLDKLLAKCQNDTQNGGYPAQTLTFHNYTENKTYTVVVNDFSEHRDKVEPVLFTYTIKLIVIGGTDAPEQDTQLTAVVGTGSGSSITQGTDATSPVSKSDSNLVNTVTDPHATKEAINKAVKKLKKKHGK